MLEESRPSVPPVDLRDDPGPHGSGKGGSLAVDYGQYSAGDGNKYQLSGDTGVSFADEKGLQYCEVLPLLRLPERRRLLAAAAEQFVETGSDSGT